MEIRKLSPSYAHYFNFDFRDKRLGDVLEGICIGSPDISKCNEIVHHYQDSLINTWFHEGRDKSFKDYVCGSAYQGCNADLVSQHLKHVEEEDAKEKEKQAEEDRRRAQEQADKKEQAERNAATSKSNTDSSQSRPKGATSSTSQQQQKKGDDKNGPTDLIMAFLNRIKNNMLRIKSLSGEMYEEVSTVVKAKDWNKLKVMLKDANFYRKYWNVLLWFFILTYTFISFVASLMAKPEPKRERRAGSTRRKAASSKASSTSSSTTAKDE